MQEVLTDIENSDLYSAMKTKNYTVLHESKPAEEIQKPMKKTTYVKKKQE